MNDTVPLNGIHIDDARHLCGAVVQTDKIGEEEDTDKRSNSSTFEPIFRNLNDIVALGISNGCNTSLLLSLSLNPCQTCLHIGPGLDIQMLEPIVFEVDMNSCRLQEIFGQQRCLTLNVTTSLVEGHSFGFHQEAGKHAIVMR